MLLLLLNPEELDQNQFDLRFDTNQVIDARRLGEFIEKLALQAEAFVKFEPGSFLTVRRAFSDSPLVVRFEIMPPRESKLGKTAQIATIGAFVLAVTGILTTQAQPAVASRCAVLMEDDSIRSLDFTFRDTNGNLEKCTVHREDMPAVHKLRSQRGYYRKTYVQSREPC